MRARTLIRGLSTAAALLPLAAVAVLLARDLHERPAGRARAAADGSSMIQGTPVSVHLAADRYPYRGIVIWPAQDATPGPRRVAVCTAVRDCVHVDVVAERDAPVRLPLAGAIREGIVSVTLERGAPLPVRRWRDGPAVEAVEGWGWPLPVRKARVFASALVGADALPWVMVLDAALVLVALAFALRSATRAPIA
jgi:hypothetical protein